MNSYFSTKRGLLHYLNMAERNYHEFLCGDMVKAKKYFYVLRPLLAAKYILRTGKIPPIEFGELRREELPEELNESVDYLLNIKVNNPEIKKIRPMIKINEFLEKEHVSLQLLADTVEDDRNKEWDDLNKLFISLVNRR